MKKRISAIVLSLVLILSAAAASFGITTAVTAADEEKIVTYATSTVWDSLNYFTTTNTNTDEVIEFLYDKLVDLNADGTVEPRLAASYEINETYDEYTFYLVDNSYWHDGEKVTAEDVVYTFQLASTADQSFVRRPNYIAGIDENGVELSEDSIEVSAPDEYTVVFKLAAPTDEITFLTGLKGWFIVPKHILSEIADADILTAEYWDAPIASGPLKYDSQIQGERFELVRFDEYYQGAVDFDRLVVRAMDASAITAGILNGEVDFTKSLLAIDVNSLKDNEDYIIESIPSFAYQNLVFNLSDDVTSNELIRRAIAKAVNRQSIVDNIYLGYAQVINALYPETHAYYNTEVTEAYDPEGAKELLAEAGWDSSTVIEFQVPTGNEARVRSSLLIQQDLAAVGIQTEIVSYDFATVLQNMRDEKFQILLMGAEGSASPSSYTGTITYFSHTTDEEILADINNGAAALSKEDKKPFYDSLQIKVAETAPLLYMYSPNSLIVHSARLTIEFGGLNVNVNKQIWTWKVSD